MKSKQVLSIEQMKHLQELGLDMGDASMHWQYLPTADAIINGTDETEKEPTLFVSQPNMKHEYPAYTLQDILDKLPESIQIYDLYIFKKVGLWWLKYVDVTNNGTVRLEKMPRLIDAAYYMLCWCIGKGYIKTN
ncbi:MAG: hypothetical protein MSH64_08220 [Bacteroides uniformis]|nr:hypothetical protein [Bacteroides uniformis]